MREVGVEGHGNGNVGSTAYGYGRESCPRFCDVFYLYHCAGFSIHYLLILLECMKPNGDS